MVALEADGSAAWPPHPTLPPETTLTSLQHHRLMNLQTSHFKSATNRPNTVSGRTQHVDLYFPLPPAMILSLNSDHDSKPPHTIPFSHDVMTLQPSECIKFDADSTMIHAAWSNNPNSTRRLHVSSPPVFSTAGGDIASAAVPKPWHSTSEPSRLAKMPPTYLLIGLRHINSQQQLPHTSRKQQKPKNKHYIITLFNA